MSNVGYITGRVLWDQGIPVEKGTVLLKGSVIGAVTAVDGTFVIAIPANQQFNSYKLSFAPESPLISPADLTLAAAVVDTKNGVVSLGDIFPWALVAVSGQVKSARDDVRSLTVYVEGTGVAAQLNELGFYVMPRTPAGKRNINVYSGNNPLGGASADLMPGTLAVVNLSV